MMAILLAVLRLTFAQPLRRIPKSGASSGFSHNRVDYVQSGGDETSPAIIDERGTTGVNAFGCTGNVSPYAPAPGAIRSPQGFSDSTLPGIDVNSDLHNFVGGVQFKDNSKETKVKPFAHLMAGIAHAKFNVSGAPAGFDFDESETGFSGIVGGGLDFRISDRVDFRAVQFDYNPTRLSGETQHNFRVGIGIVFR